MTFSAQLSGSFSATLRDDRNCVSVDAPIVIREGDAIETGVTGEVISGHTALVTGIDGKLHTADPLNDAEINAIAGIALQSASIDTLIQYRSHGKIVEPSWNWQPQKPIFVGLNGLLTQSVPTHNLICVGWAIDADSMFVDIQLRVKRSV